MYSVLKQFYLARRKQELKIQLKEKSRRSAEGYPGIFMRGLFRVPFWFRILERILFWSKEYVQCGNGCLLKLLTIGFST